MGARSGGREARVRARAFLDEILAAGADALAVRTRGHERFAEQPASIPGGVARRAPAAARVPHVCIGAINVLVTDDVIHRGAETLPELPEPIVAVEEALLLPPARRGA